VAAVLNVTQPTSTGLGGDAFCLFYDAKSKSVKGINASGRCAEALSLDALESMGYNEQKRPDRRSALWVTVPGAAAGWVDTVENFGSGNLTLAQILEPAIKLAEEGYPVNEITAYYWKVSEALLQSAANGEEMLLNGRAPNVGEIIKLPNLAKSFRELATNGKEGFYNGAIAQSIIEVVQSTGGKLSLEDLRTHVSTFDEPISINYRGVDVYEMPPNGQGITALLALNILEGFEIGNFQHNSAEHLHLVLESLRLSFADTKFYVSDPAFSSIPVSGMISKDYATQRRNLIKLDEAIPTIEHGFPENISNTVYFNVVDRDGNACSFINSNYLGFGTGIIPKGWGFTLQNRGDNFSLDPNHSNRLEPKKRPYHTIIPGMALKDGELFCPFGVMGGFMQPQGHLQVISNMVDFNMDPQMALDSPRVEVLNGNSTGQILLEDGIPETVRAELQRMGHQNPVIWTGWDRSEFGTGQIIRRDPVTGVLCAGSDPRNDGCAMGW